MSRELTPAVHHPERNREQQKPDRAAPVPNWLQEKGRVSERDHGAYRERQRRQTNQQPAEGSHAVNYRQGLGIGD